MTDGPVVITATDIYRKLMSVSEKVVDLSHDVKDLTEAFEDQEPRLRAVETRVWVASGVVAVVATTAGIAAPFLVR